MDSWGKIRKDTIEYYNKICEIEDILFDLINKNDLIHDYLMVELSKIIAPAIVRIKEQNNELFS